MNTIELYPESPNYQSARETLTFTGTDEDGRDIFSDLGINELWREFEHRCFRANLGIMEDIYQDMERVQ